MKWLCPAAQEREKNFLQNPDIYLVCPFNKPGNEQHRLMFILQHEIIYQEG